MLTSKVMNKNFVFDFIFVEVDELNSGYDDTSNIKNYEIDYREKPSINQQIKVIIMTILIKDGLGYYIGVRGEEDKAITAIKESIKIFIFLQNNRGVLSRDIY